MTLGSLPLTATSELASEYFRMRRFTVQGVIGFLFFYYALVSRGWTVPKYR